MAAKYLKPFRFGKKVLTFISIRRSGNISFHVGDDPKKVIRNRRLLADGLKINPANLISADQVHGNRVKVIIGKPLSLRSTDAMVTDIPGICLMVQVADCVPLLFYDRKAQVIGVAHAGWKGTALKIAQKTVQTMHKKFGSRPNDILVGIGPSIGPCCYEVGPEVSRKFGKKGRVYLDLRRENRDQLTRLGIPPRNIQIVDICTKCNSRQFFSARASNGVIGRFGAGIMLL